MEERCIRCLVQVQLHRVRYDNIILSITLYFNRLVGLKSLDRCT